MNISKGHIYIIFCHINPKIYYIGSTFNELKQRWMEHKKAYRNKTGLISIYKYFDEYGIDNFSLKLIKTYDVYRENNKDRKHLQAYEQLWMNKLKCINKCCAFQPLKKERRKIYSQKPEVKAMRKISNSKPEAKAKAKEYMKNYELNYDVKKYRKEYQQRPEVIARRKAKASTPEAKAKAKEYRDNPETKLKMKEYKKIYDQKPEMIFKRKQYAIKKKEEKKQTE